MNSQRVVIIGAGEFQRPLLNEAKKKGLETHVVAWADGAVIKEECDHFHEISIIEKEEILSLCQELDAVAVCSIASELAMETVSYVCEKLQLNANSIQSSQYTRNKGLMKNQFQKNGVDCARGGVFSQLPEAQQMAEEILKDEDCFMVKPADRSGSAGVEMLSSLDEFSKAFKKAQELSIAKEVIVESFVTGKEYSLECVSYNGEHKVIAVTEKRTSGAPHFVETGHMQPARLSTEQEQNLIDLTLKGLAALEITHGISHAELKIDDAGKAQVIEIGGRMGGDYIGSDLTLLSTGVDLTSVALNIALQQFSWDDIKISPSDQKAIVVFAHAEKHSSLEPIETVPLKGIKILREEIQKKAGDEVEQISSSCKRFGHLLYMGEDFVSNEELLAHFALRIS